MSGILTRRIGPFPGWVWAALAGGGFLAFMYFRRRQGQAAGQPGLPAVSPAASAVPFVPSVTVTGIPPSSAPSPSAPAPGRTLQLVQSAPDSPQGIPVYSLDRSNQGIIGYAPTGSSLPFISQTVGFGGDPGYVVAWAGSNAFVSGRYVASVGSGSGGWGYAGSGSLAAPIGGWTVGWMPFGAGAGPSINRRGTARRSRRLFGGSGDSANGSGGSSVVNRTRGRATRPLRQRDLRGR